MDAIAEINELSCYSIESGDYETALDTLSCSLKCLGSLTKSRQLMAKERNLCDYYSSQNKNKNKNAVYRNNSDRILPIIKKETEIVTKLLKCAKRKLAVNRRPQCWSEDNDNNDITTTAKTEDHYFVYRKPLRLTNFQWSQIECQSQIDIDYCDIETGIVRELELTISSILIFNIALAHHLLACSNSNSNSNINSNSSNSSNTEDSPMTKQHLYGALLMYELGYKTCTKRLAYVASSQTRLLLQMETRIPLQTSPSAASASPATAAASIYPPSSSTPNTNANTATATAIVRGVSMSSAATDIDTDSPPLQVTATTPSVRSCNLHRGRDEDFKSTTRYALALLNNCGHIHKTLGHTQTAAKFRKQLLSDLMVIIDSVDSVHEVVGDDPAFDGYLENVLAGTVFGTDASPAAMA